MTDVEIPKRMRKRPRDRRGYPIPKAVYIDDQGKPHFQITDQNELKRLLKFDLCPMCGAKLKEKRWFVGGPKSAFYLLGGYFDPPMHDECAHYALKVCPYLAAPTYSRRIEGKSIKDTDRNIVTVDDRVEIDRPPVFVAVETYGQSVQNNLIIPRTPYSKIEYWLHGTQMSQAEGEAMCKTGKENMNGTMRTPKETAAHMREKYGKDAGIHCMYAIMNNEGTTAAQYWREVRSELDKKEELR